MEEKIILDQESFKALAADTRVKILKILGKRRHTQTELAADLNLSIPTVKEHLKALEKADLVSMKDEGRKWKYYELSRKGRGILDPEMKKIWILLSIIGLMAFAGLSGIIKQAFSPMYGFGSLESQSFDSINSAKIAKDNTIQSGATPVPKTAESSAPVAAMNAGGVQARGTDKLIEDKVLTDNTVENFTVDNTREKTLIDKGAAVEKEYKLPRPDFSGFSFNTGSKIYLGIIGILLGLLSYFTIIRHKRMH